MLIANRTRLRLLLLIMSGSLTVVGGLTLILLYHTELEQRRDRLVELAQTQARLIEAVGRFDAAHAGTPEDTLLQVRNAHDQIIELGETGEFTLARLDRDQIVFLLNHRHGDAIDRRSIPTRIQTG